MVASERRVRLGQSESSAPQLLGLEPSTLICALHDDHLCAGRSLPDRIDTPGPTILRSSSASRAGLRRDSNPGGTTSRRPRPPHRDVVRSTPSACLTRCITFRVLRRGHAEKGGRQGCRRCQWPGFDPAKGTFLCLSR